nr:BppU family phage baseplate upper protein [Enterococcus crotali]
MSIVYPIFLSITQPNDNIPTIMIRQFDEGTQVLDVTVTEHGKPKDISNLTPFSASNKDIMLDSVYLSKKSLKSSTQKKESYNIH